MPCATTASRSPTASSSKPATRSSSAGCGSTCSSSGSRGSPLRIRAAKPRGTLKANPASPSGRRSASSCSPSSASSSRGSVMASRSDCRQSDRASGRGKPYIVAARIGAARPRAARGTQRSTTHMASYGLNDVKNGLKIIVDGDPYVIVDADFIKPGKGQAFTRIKIRNLKNGRVTEKTLKATDTVEGADVVDTDMQYLYNDGEFWHFMQPDSFEQHTADRNTVGDAAQWLKGEEM